MRLGPEVAGAGTRDSPCARSRPRRQPAPGSDQAACERRDSCSCLKYAGYFYLPTSGSEGHPTSGLGGCYTIFPFSREGKWREARLPDHMVLKSMKKRGKKMQGDPSLLLPGRCRPPPPPGLRGGGGGERRRRGPRAAGQAAAGGNVNTGWPR